MKMNSLFVMVFAISMIKSQDGDCKGCKRFFKVNTVCGFDGVTYKNECYSRCNETGIAHFGACSTNSQPCGCPDVYAPVQDIQGNFYVNECVCNCKGKVAIKANAGSQSLSSHQ